MAFMRSLLAAEAVLMSLGFTQATAFAQRGFLEGTPKPPTPIPDRKSVV